MARKFLNHTRIRALVAEHGLRVSTTFLEDFEAFVRLTLEISVEANRSFNRQTLKAEELERGLLGATGAQRGGFLRVEKGETK